jgi:DNA replication protein DnaC
VVSGAAAPLAPDLAAGLRRLKLAAMRQLAPELLITAKTQRWAPEELLRTLIDAEITARDASNARTRLKAASFPVTKTLEEFDRTASSIPGSIIDYLASLEWIRAAENLCPVGPAGTGKSSGDVRAPTRYYRRRSTQWRYMKPATPWSPPCHLTPTPSPR